MTALSTWEREDQGDEGFVDDEGMDAFKYAELTGINIPNDNQPDEIFEVLTIPCDVRFLICSGPYHTLAPGEEIEITLAVAVGSTYDEFIANVDSAISFYQRGYVYFDDDPPEVNCWLSAVKPVYSPPGTEDTICVYVGDPSGVSKVTAQIGGNEGEILDSLDLPVGKRGFCKGIWRNPPDRKSDYTVSVTAKDRLGNEKSWANVCGFTTKRFEKTANILVVDDDNYNCPNWGPTRKPYETYYTAALARLSLFYLASTA